MGEYNNIKNVRANDKMRKFISEEHTPKISHS